MAAPNSQIPAGPGSKNPTVVQNKEAGEPDASSIERERLAAECKAIKEQYLKEAAIRTKKYEAEMRQELIDTYFSDRDIFGDKVFEETGIDGVKAKRYAGAESYADPVAYVKKKEASAKSAANTSTGKIFLFLAEERVISRRGTSYDVKQYLEEAVIRAKKYKADMRQELLETYFSDKDISGGQATNGFTDILKKNLVVIMSLEFHNLSRLQI